MLVRAGAELLFAIITLAVCSAAAWAGEPRLAFDVDAEFEKFDPTYLIDRRVAREPLPGFGKQVQALESSDDPATRCAQERLTELRITTHDTADFAKARAETDALQRLLADPGAEATPDTQDAEGAWGRCYTLWYLRLDTSYDAISERATALPIPAHFLDRVNSPTALADYLRRIAVSDIAAEGVNHRRELNYALSALMRLILHDQPVGYAWAPGMKEAVRHLILDELRDPASSVWGPRYRQGGRTIFKPDVSITFHVVKYLHGDVSDWPKIIDTLFAMRDLAYPQGWREGDGFLAHDLYDVATLFHLGWTRVDPARQARMAGALGEMLDWCLAKVVAPDGSVTVYPGDDSVETATYFAVGLLGELGAFNPADRFWTTRDIPDGPSFGTRIVSRIQDTLARGGGAEGGTYYRNALQRLISDGIR